MTSFAPDQYKEALIFLGTAGVVVPLFWRLKVSPVLGFLGAGILLGPYGVGALAKILAGFLLSLSKTSSRSRRLPNSAWSFSSS